MATEIKSERRSTRGSGDSRASAAVNSAAPGTLRLASPFGCHMVLQCEQLIKIWGVSTPSDRLEISLATTRVSAKADESGCFEAVLPPMPPGGPHELKVSGDGGHVVLEDVMIGEVWLCCGQSNMLWPVNLSTMGEEIAADAARPSIRLLKVPGMEGLPPGTPAQWMRCTPDCVRDFSAIAYLCGRELNAKLDRPIGLMLAAWSGSHVEAWMSREALLNCAGSRQDLLDFETCCAGDYSVFTPPSTTPRVAWAQSVHDDTEWPLLTLPSAWQDVGQFHHGVMWFRRRPEIPEKWAGQDLMLSLGRCADEDQVYLNGTLIGSTAAGPPGRPSQIRQYTLPSHLIRPGANTLAVRVTGHREGCGLVGPPDAMFIRPASGPDAEKISLTGAWRYSVESQTRMRRVTVHSWLANRKTAAHALFDSVIAPLIPFAIRGVLWYQGEQNAWQGARYYQLFSQLIRDWRSRWAQGDFPFQFIQIPNAQAKCQRPSDSDKAELREAQAKTLSEPATAMAVTIDCGEVDLHPRDKRTVAQRLANVVLATVYGQRVPHRGPRYSGHDIDGNTAIVSFAVDSGSLRTRHGEPVTGFAVAGEDRRFEWATAIIEGTSVLVQSPLVPRPVAVRYGWANNPECNLYDGADLPAEPFRTDTWPALTE